MTVVVSFILPKQSGNATGIQKCRVRENLAPGGTTTNVVQPGEFVVIGNSETTMVAVAFGSNPDAAANGIPVPAGAISYPLYPNAGDVINAKAVT